MSYSTTNFTHDFRPGAIHYGRGCIDRLDEVLADRGLESVLVVTGQTIGATEAVMAPVAKGLGDRSSDIFDETTPGKALETVFAGIDLATQADVDAIVGIGGGSSLDVATGIAALYESDYTLQTAYRDVIDDGVLELPDDRSFLPVISIPTTLAGADLSIAAGLVAHTNSGAHEVIIADKSLMPIAFVYDPDLFDTTPMDVLAGSAINGFDKGVEAIYSRFANPVTDATAVRGLSYLRRSLPTLRTADDPAVMERAVLGTILVQYGVSVPDAYKINIVHAFGHALRNEFGMQQGIAHAVIVPHALRLIFEEGGGRPEVLAEGLVPGAEPDDLRQAIIESVIEIRDGLELPSRLRDVPGTSRDRLRITAERVAEDDFLDIGPPSFDPSIDEIESTLSDAW